MTSVTQALFRLDWKRWLVLVVASFAFLWWAGLGATVQRAFEALASQPDVQTAFTDAEHGRMDALLMLVSVAALAPVSTFLVLLALVFALILLALLLEPLLGTLRLPAWLTVVIVLASAAWAAWALREAWVPHLVHLTRLVARAWVVYFSTPALPR